eukprot:CAMPEP_0116039162 /NCGR_PEP_ID=MMETSP0321-20121206/23340_1 /TAXON_ID=163516 /ORGANISM="Leptocylindrus danicus var. danicus, Strain B650" /LENGTH=476 /DNA_ID=CAMNT_0003518215 /DNA_START=3 /DNA_END=1433 /DNA_ORIENTATION=-
MTEITITLVYATPSGATLQESILTDPNDTTLESIQTMAMALFNIDENTASMIQIHLDGRLLASQSTNTHAQSLSDAGVRDGDLLYVTSKTRSSSDTNNNNGASSNGGPNQNAALDFSNLLSGATSNNHSASATSSGGGLDFSTLLTAGPSSSSSSSQSNNHNNNSNGGVQAVEWPGMNLDDAMARNKNPDAFVRVLFKYENIMKELNYHSPVLAGKLKACNGNVQEAAKVYREFLVKGSISSAMARTTEHTTEKEMRRRLETNPMDETANKYFGEKIQQENVMKQYYEMMEKYPESMGRVLMLYIDAEVNGHSFQAFVDSGAQQTIMSSAFAEKLGVLHLVDKRFHGVAVGVGTGKILGRIHIVDLNIKGHLFPCSITVMDSSEGLGDKNMDFLLGLDMLKRHRCKIDLESNNLIFTLAPGEYLETPFLHEKDLSEAKGGTKGFDADAANAELQRAIEDSVANADSKMDVDDNEKN